MAKKRRKKPGQTPNFILWSAESQKRFTATMDKFADLVADQVSQLQCMEFVRACMVNTNLVAVETVEQLKVMVEAMLKRSSAAAKANATRKSHQAQGGDLVAGPAIAEAPELTRAQEDELAENARTQGYIHHPAISDNGQAPADLVEVVPDELTKGG